MKNKQTSTSSIEKRVYSEWLCRRDEKRENGELIVTAEKIKILRPRVKITQEQADLLNHGILEIDVNKEFSMYFPAEETNNK